MTPSGIASFDSTVHSTNLWLHEIMELLSWGDRQRAYQALRAVLHTLRDRLPVDHTAALGAQLPMLIRGIYYEGWRPNRTPVRERKKVDFLGHIAASLRDATADEVEDATRAVLSVLAKHVSKGEVENVKLTLPHEIRELWNTPTHTLWF